MVKRALRVTDSAALRGAARMRRMKTAKCRIVTDTEVVAERRAST